MVVDNESTLNSDFVPNRFTPFRATYGMTEKDDYGTRYSQAVTHPSTNRALHCLTSVIGRERVLSMWYGRRQ